MVAVEVGTRGEKVQQLAFTTSSKRWPGQSGYYARHAAETFRTIKAPRVTGLFGWHGTGYGSQPIYSIGLEFLVLADNTKSRDFLLAMEPFLFPDHIYDDA